MPATMSNQRDIYLALLADMLFVERMLSFEALPKMLADAGDPSLAGALAGHLEQTKAHVGRVEQAFGAAGAEASSNHSLPFGGLVEQHRQLAASAVTTALGDLMRAHAALHAEAYEIASYRVLVVLAESVAPGALSPLRENLAEEEAAAAALRQLLAELVSGDPRSAPFAGG
jgi:ferritin-like metal-binding protein YciE